MSHTFLLLESIHPAARELLESAGLVVLSEGAEEASEVAKRMPVHAILTRGKGRVDESLISLCKELKVIARVGVGLDNIDVTAAGDRGVLVVNAPGSTTTAVAEHSLLLIAALVRGLIPMAHAVKSGDWDYRSRYAGDDLSEKKLGIIGMGAIGERVAALAEAFGMSIAYWNRSEKPVPYRRLSLDDLLAESDVVSVSVALTPDTRSLLGPSEFAAMKPGALLVNTSRGAVVDQDALVDALASGRLGGFAADVLRDEPPRVDDPLLAFDNVIVTPHAAALTERTYRRMCLTTVEKVIRLTPDESRPLEL